MGLWDLVGPRLFGGKAPDPFTQIVVDQVTFTDQATLNTQLGLTASSTLTFSDVASCQLVRAVSASSTIAFSDAAAGARQVSAAASSTLAFSDVASVVVIKAGVASSTLAFSDQAVGTRVIPASSTITFTDQAVVQKILNFSIVDSIGFTDGAYATTGRLAPVCGNPLFPALSIRDKFTFTFGMLVVDCRIPEFGNTQTFRWEKVVRRTRGGQLSIPNSSFSEKDTYKFSFKALSADLRNDLENFFIVSAGKQIQILDHENSTFLGVVLSPQIVFAQEGIGCQFAFSFEFRGIKQ